MAEDHFATRAALERQMEAARQLRAETVPGVVRLFLARAVETVRRTIGRVALRHPRQA